MLASRKAIYPLLIVISVLAGWLIPAFYAWTDSDQSRPSSLLWLVPMGTALVSVALCITLPWWPAWTESDAENVKKGLTRFAVRSLLIATSVIALVMVLLMKFPTVTSGIISALAFIYFVAFFVGNSQYCMASLALVACMVFPFAWLLGYGELDRLLPDMAIMFAGMPAFFPAAFLGRLFGQNMHDAPWLSFLLSALELTFGTWVIRLGPKRTLAYLLLVLHLSFIGSLFFYMAVRA